jgi:DNA-binding NtrC family response regulator
MTAPEAPEAIALVAQRPGDVQLVLTDLMLPHMDGVSLVRAMTKIKPDMRFIASTGQGEQTRASELHSLGVHHFLSKPYDSQKLLQTLHEALNTESK